jgi:hypothetical protein
MVTASRRARVAAIQLRVALKRAGLDPSPLTESGNIVDGWIMSFEGADGEEYHVEVCAAWLKDNESEFE